MINNRDADSEMLPLPVKVSAVAVVARHVLQELYFSQQVQDTQLSILKVPEVLQPPQLLIVKSNTSVILTPSKPNLIAPKTNSIVERNRSVNSPAEVKALEFTPQLTMQSPAKAPTYRAVAESTIEEFMPLLDFVDTTPATEALAKTAELVTDLRLVEDAAPIAELLEPETFASLPEAAETKDLQQAVQKIAVADIVETIGVSEETAEQATVFLSLAPEDIQQGIAEFMLTAKPEAAEIVETLIMDIAILADELHTAVVQLGINVSEVSIELLADITEKYTELLETLGIEVDDEVIKAFIALVCTEDYKLSAKFMLVEPYDPMHERHRWVVLGNDHTGLSLLRSELYNKAAQVAGRYSMIKNAVLQVA